MKHNVLGVPRLSIFRAAPIAKWQQAAGLPKNAFTSNGITALGLLPFHQKCGRATPQGEAQRKARRRPLWPASSTLAATRSCACGTLCPFPDVALRYEAAEKERLGRHLPSAYARSRTDA